MRKNLHFPKLAYIGGGGGGARFGAEKHFYWCIDNTCDIADFRAHIFRSQATQELPKNHNEAGRPEQLPHTRHYDLTTALPPSE